MSEVISGSATTAAPTYTPQAKASDAPHPGSLHARMRARAKELRAQRTEIFPVPGYARVLHVELVPLELETMHTIAERNGDDRVVANRLLHTAADQLVAATVRFHEIDEDGNRAPADTSWQELASGVLEHVPEDITPRMAVIALFGDPASKLIFFMEGFHEWANGERSSINSEVAQDFGKTR